VRLRISNLLCIIITFTLFLSNTVRVSGTFNVPQSMIFDNMYANYIFSYRTDVYLSYFNYSKISTDQYNVTWKLEEENNTVISSWIEESESRLISNSTGPLAFNEGTHAKLWIFTNLSQRILVTINGDGDHSFRVIGDLILKHSGIGNLEVWVLENLNYTGTYVLYEKRTGILVDGEFQSSNSNYTLHLIETNIFTYYQSKPREISGYNIFYLIISLTVITGILMKKKQRK